MEQKVQTYVKSLCLQNEQCKTFISQEVEDKDKVQAFLAKIQMGQQEDARDEEDDANEDYNSEDQEEDSQEF